MLCPHSRKSTLRPLSTSPSSAREFKHYRALDSLQEYILIAQDAHHVEHYVRQPDDRWLLSEADDLSATIRLPSIDCTLALADVYDKVDIEAESGETRIGS